MQKSGRKRPGEKSVRGERPEGNVWGGNVLHLTSTPLQD